MDQSVIDRLCVPPTDTAPMDTAPMRTERAIERKPLPDAISIGAAAAGVAESGLSRRIFQQHGHALTDADAECRDAAFDAATPHFVSERAGEPGARAAEWVTERDAAAVDVESIVFNADRSRAGECLRGEGLV